MKERVLLEPVGFLFAERAVVCIVCTRPVEGAERLFQHSLFKLFDALEVDEGAVRLIREEDVPLRQPAAGDQILEIDEHNVACKCRDGLIGRVAVPDGTEREDLPDLLPRLGEKVKEAVRLPAEVAHTVF